MFKKDKEHTKLSVSVQEFPYKLIIRAGREHIINYILNNNIQYLI